MSISGLTRSAASLLGAAAVMVAGSAWAGPLLGQPTPGDFGLQPAASEVAHDVAFFHNAVLMPIVTIIVLFVMGLLAYVSVRFNKRANPAPARFTHNTPIEVVWTIAPVVILLFIAIFSYKLLFAYHDMPRADLTVKATGVQWYWKYEYPDQEIGEFVSNMLPEDEAMAAGRPYRLAVDNPMVVPVGAVVRIQTTGEDVIHAFALPAFGNKMDAIPGRLNEQWFRAEREGIYYGQCSELCGVDHAYMPIQVNVVSRPAFNAWVLAQGGRIGPRPVTAAAQPPAPAGDAAAPQAVQVPADAAVSPAGANPDAPSPTGGDPAPNVQAPAAGAQPAPAQ